MPRTMSARTYALPRSFRKSAIILLSGTSRLVSHTTVPGFQERNRKSVKAALGDDNALAAFDRDPACCVGDVEYYLASHDIPKASFATSATKSSQRTRSVPST